MKNLLTIAPIIVLLTACAGSQLPEGQAKAETLVKRYLKDSVGYTPINFDTLRVEQLSYIVDNTEGRRLDSMGRLYMDSSLSYRKKADQLVLNSDKVDTIRYANYQKMDALYVKKSDSIATVIQAKSKNYQSKNFLYAILHTYTVKDNLGHEQKHIVNFSLDSGLTKVLQWQEAQ